MAENTKIEWTDHTFNPWIGCTKVGPGCDHCYADQLMGGKGEAPVAGEGRRLRRTTWGAGQPRIRTVESTWAQPRKWARNATAFHVEHGRRQRVFCSSLADVFDNEVDPQWRADLLDLISDTHELDWLLLTKRIGNVAGMMEELERELPENVWLGATVVNQHEADRDIPKLLEHSVAVRFLSMEPLLGPVDLRAHLGSVHHHPDNDQANEHVQAIVRAARERLAPGGRIIDWVIVGGESGRNARPLDPAWVHSLRDQCAEAGVPFLFKQWGEWAPTPIAGAASSMMRHTPMYWHGKKGAGRELSGRTHDGFPAA